MAGVSKRIEFSGSVFLQMREKSKTKKVQVPPYLSFLASPVALSSSQVTFQSGGGNGDLIAGPNGFVVSSAGGVGNNAQPKIQPPTGAGGGFAQFSSAIGGGSSSSGSGLLFFIAVGISSYLSLNDIETV
jgi:hypothetical protein